MTTVTFATRVVNQLRRRAQRAAELPESGPEDWSVSPVSPLGMLAVFDTLRLEPGLTLHAYEFRSGGNGNGVVWAMPEHVPAPPPEACLRLDEFLAVPKPIGALDDVMDAIEGDGTPFSFLSASLLARDLREFGARWHGISWGACRIIGRRPTGERDRAARWTWLQPAPVTWSPCVRVSADAIEVRLHVYDPVGRETIRQLTDTYRPGRYTCITSAVDLAIGDGGIIW